MKTYLGASHHELERAREVMTFLELAGHTITYDWTQAFKDPVKDYLKYARADIAGVYSADVVVLLFENPHPYRGTHTELGLAIAFRKPVIILGKEADKNIFSRLENVSICYQLKDVLTLLDELEKGDPE